MRKLIKSISSLISINNNYTRDEEEQVEYALKILVFEVLKTLGIIIIFSLMGHATQAIIAIGAMSFIKPFIGGYHEDNQLKCFTATALIIGGIIYLSTSLNIDFISRLILNVIALFSIWHRAPVLNPLMPITKPELIKRNRTIGILIAIILAVISTILYKKAIISNTILWTLIFQVLLMFNKKKYQEPLSL